MLDQKFKHIRRFAVAVLFVCTLASGAGAYNVSGVITFQDFSASTTIPVTIELRRHSDNSITVRNVNVPSTTGAYSITGVVSGTYDITYKANRWLRSLLKNVVVTSNASGKNISLLNGDATLDDKIDKHDYFKVRNALHTVPGDARWRADADLNGDNAINLWDLRAAMKNFGKWGESTAGSWVIDPVSGLIDPIILAPTAMGRLNTTATELQGFLGQMLGQTAQIRSAYDTSQGIILGTTADFPQKAAQENLQSLGSDGYMILSENDRLWILGNTDKAVEYGVYAFLESMGCRWYSPDPAWTIIPSNPFPYYWAQTRVTPAFDYRRIWYGGGVWNTPYFEPHYYAWMKHNRMYGSFGIECYHVYPEYVSPSLYAAHPEYFALVGGQRVNPASAPGTWQPCTSNQNVINLFVSGVSAKLNVPGANMASIEPNDGGQGDFCQCPACVAQGSYKERPYVVANTVASQISATHPGKWLGLLSYSSYSNVPNFNLQPNIFVMVCGFIYNYSDPFQTDQERIAGLRARGAKVGYYDYLSGPEWDNCYPGESRASRFHEYAASLRNYYDWQARTYDAQMSIDMGATGLGTWIGSKLLWDRNQDDYALANDFYTKAFKQAALKMSSMYERWSTGGHITETVGIHTLKQSIKDVYEAYFLESDPQVRARLDQVAMYLHWMRLQFEYDNSVARHDPPAALREYVHQAMKYTRRIEDLGIVHSFWLRYHEGIDGYGYLNSRYEAARLTYPTQAEWIAAADGWAAEGQVNNPNPPYVPLSDIPSSSEVWNTLVADYDYYW